MKPFATPNLAHLATLGAALIVVGLPMGMTLAQVLAPSGWPAWRELTVGELAAPALWRPLATTMIVGLVASILATVIGASFAVALALMPLPGRALLNAVTLFPLMLPGFAGALAWTTLFANERLGANVGLFASVGLSPPDWLAWGLVPTTIALALASYPLVMATVRASLRRLDGALIESARLSSASAVKVVLEILLPGVRPALVSGFMLCFAYTASNFATPAILGLPVHMHTLSTRLFSMIEIGQIAHALVIAMVLLVVAGSLVGAAERMRGAETGGRQAPTPIAPLPGRVWTASALSVWAIALVVALGPLLVLLASSLAESPNLAFRSVSLNAWTGPEGVLRDDALPRALWVTLQLGVVVAVGAIVLALALARGLNAPPGAAGPSLTQRASAALCFVPLLVPDIVFATAYITAYGDPPGALPPLYGTFALLAMAMIAHLSPFAIETVRGVLAQMDPKIEEAARLAGAGPLAILAGIVAPAVAPGLLAGAVFVFVKSVRNIATVVVLATPATATLSILAFRASNEGFVAQANAVTLIVAALAMAGSATAAFMERRHGERG